jgi:hypothetical protein
MNSGEAGNIFQKLYGTLRLLTVKARKLRPGGKIHNLNFIKMKRIILIGAFVLAGATAIVVASNNCTSCPVCPEGSCPIEKCGPGADCCKK